MYNYRELGLVNTREMFQKAYKEQYAVPAFNFISIEQYNAIIDAAAEKRSPVILLASPNLHKQLGYEMVARVVQAGTDRLKNMDMEIPVALHLDHGMSFEQCVAAVENGFSSVMIDGSALPFEENIALTKRVVEYAHERDVTVEGELGVLSGAEEEGDENRGESSYTDPAMVEEFVKRTGVDCLAVSVGTCHGLVKLKVNDDGTLPELRYDLIEDMQKRLPGFPLVLHGASTIRPEWVDMINQYGGKVEQAVGIPEEQIEKAVKMAVCKVNIASDGWICALANTRRILAENPGAIDSRVFTLKNRPILKELYEHKIEIMGSQQKY
ncbi:MAG TPA: ketose-bisphosphate aldolase [Candidatus Pelethocola excrementipullorum]|nr:ketose-bisphosphate aldolase [Candidatus Pelethocola excrementipullorum]